MMRSILSLLFVLIIIVLIASCGGSNLPSNNERDTTTATKDTIRIANDSLEYEVIITEIGFNSWLATQPPRGYRSQSSMDLSNDRQIPIYNSRVNNPFSYDADLYPFRIDYDRNVDYGYEVTYLLFNYFKFFEQRYNQRL